MTYKGRYKIKNPDKYKGNPTKVVFRSLWERQVFRWCDNEAGVLKWSSEEIIIPYRCKTDNKVHRYFPDVFIETKHGNYLIEIKPKKETTPPRNSSKKTKRYLNEVMTYIKNTSKWAAAEDYCDDRGYIFQIWTEVTLKSLGIKLLT
tara:strand:- start:1671 stop:2111 length:441 start_codon:yes stop_codon:yes gene_type:complete